MPDPFTNEHQLFRKTVRDYVTRELLPHRHDWEAARAFPRDLFKRMGELGFFAIGYPENSGGLGGDFWYKLILGEELLRSRMSGLVMSILVHSDMATPVIAALGTDEQKQEFLVPALQGDKIAALGISEPDAGSDVAAIRTTAVSGGDDYMVNGSKTFITNGSIADFITLAVRTDRSGIGGAGHKGLSILLFPTHTPGFKVGRKLDKLGNHTSDTAELVFENCRVPKRYRLGEENRGFAYLMANFKGERLLAAHMAVASSEIMWEDAKRYLGEREAFGQTIGTFQVWRHRLADMETEIAAARLLVHHACDLFVKGSPCDREITMAKLFAAELANRVAYDCLQAHGGYGYMEEYDIARMSRDVRALTIAGGTSDIMREILAKEYFP